MKLIKKAFAVLGIFSLALLLFFLFLPYGVYIEYQVKFNPVQAWSFVMTQAPIEYAINSSETDQAVTGTGRTIKAFLDAIGTTRKATIKVLHTSTSDYTDYTVSTGLTITSNVATEMDHGARLSDGGGSANLIINSPFNPGLYQVFDWTGSGLVTFGDGAVKEVYPEWFEQNTTPGTTDMITAMQAAENSLGSRGGIIFLSATDYWISELWKVGTGAAGYAIVVQGSGPVATNIKANLTTALIQSPDTAAANYRVTFREFGIYNTSKTNAGSIGIDLTNQYLARLDNIRISDVETGVKIAGAAAYYNELYGVEVHNAVTGIILTGTRANENKIFGGRMDGITTGINVDEAYNFFVNGMAIEGGTTGIILNDTEAKVIGCLFDTITTGISITASGVNNVLIGNTYPSCTTDVSDSGTNTQRYESDGPFQACETDGMITKSTFAKEFFAQGSGLDDTLALAITFNSQNGRYVNHIVEVHAALGDSAAGTNYSSIVRYSVVSLEALTITDMTHDLVGGVTEAVGSAGTVMTITLTMPGAVDIDYYSVWVKITCSELTRGIPTGITVS